MTVIGCGTPAATAAATSANAGPAISSGAPASVAIAVSSGAASRQFSGTATAPIFARRGQQLDHLGRAAVEVGDARAGPRARGEHHLGEPVRALVELAVGHRAVAVADRDHVRARRGHAAHDVRHPQ